MNIFRSSIALLVLFVGVACGSSESTGNASSAPSSAPFGCCEIGDAPPPRCALRYGRAKQSADDSCSDGHDGTDADSSQPGWTKVTDADGCPRWTPPAEAEMICCGCAGLDAGQD